MSLSPTSENSGPLVITADGSHTVVNPTLRVTYHSTHGAIQESNHVFIRHGLEFKAAQHQVISILEVGLGTGLNAFLSYLFSVMHPELELHYHAVEKFPLSEDILRQLNYVSQLGAEKHHTIFDRIHRETQFSSNRFHFTSITGDILDIHEKEQFDIVFFDAFDPVSQPEMWEPAVFQKLKESMKTDGILVTYCAQGQFKRTLKSLGFIIEALPGPPGKREMVRARKG